jgi:hypothetical protein
MKKIVLFSILLFSLNSLAQVVPGIFPNVFTFSNSVQVRIFNHTDKNIICQGQVFAWTIKGRFRNYFYYRPIGPKMNDFHQFFNFDPTDRFRNANANIRCQYR